VIVGTAAYMSPEQAKGRTADKRSDIWAFGVVLYEMLTGRQLFGGETVTEVIAAVIKDTPSLDALPPSTPAPLRRLMERCLERDPRSRLRDIGEARIALARTNQTADGASAPRRRSLANGRREPVTGGQDVNSVRLGSPGRLLFLRVGANDGLWATALTRNTIDLSKGSLLEPGAVEFDAASDSLIAIFPAKDRRELVWLSRGGVTTDIAGAPFDTSTGDIALSPDGRRAVLAMRGPNLTGYFVVRDLETGADTRVPQPAGAEHHGQRQRNRVVDPHATADVRDRRHRVVASLRLAVRWIDRVARTRRWTRREDDPRRVTVVLPA